jgi:hypothetical protein
MLIKRVTAVLKVIPVRVLFIVRARFLVLISKNGPGTVESDRLRFLPFQSESMHIHLKYDAERASASHQELELLLFCHGNLRLFVCQI